MAAIINGVLPSGLAPSTLAPCRSSRSRKAPATMDAETLEFIQGLFALVREGDTQQLGAMLAQGVPVNFRNEKGDSLIMLASYHGHLETSRLLLEAGADANVPNDQGQTPLAGVAYKGYLDIADRPVGCIWHYS